MGKRIIAVAVGVLVAVAPGVVGVLVASRSGQRTPATLPALDVSSSSDQAGTSAQAAPGRSSPVDAAESRIPPSGRVQYQVRGTLPDLPRSARAWTLPDQVTKARVAELAGKLGLSGQPTSSGQAWSVSDGSKRLFVNQVAGGPWTFSAGRFVQAPRQVALPDRAGAERIARDLFGRVAAPMNGAEMQLVQSFDRWSVSAFPRVGGQPTTGFIWTAGIGAKGEILSATGWLDSPRQGDDYPLISVREALQRLRNRQVAGPITDESGRMPCARTEQPQPPAGGCRPAKPPTLQVTNVRLGLQFATALATGGSRQSLGYLVPAYLFQVNGSWERQVGVIAVQDRFLGTTPEPTAVPLRPGG